MDNIKDIIQQRYNLKIINIEKNINSTNGNVYNITTKDTKYILKMYKDINHVHIMSNLFNKLKNEHCYIPNIYKTIDNKEYIKYLNYYIIVYTYLIGSEIGNIFENIPNEISVKLAKELRKMHDMTETLSNINLPKVNFYDKSERKSLLHFDLTRNNIFYNKEKSLIGFIDFDDAKYGDSVIDISILIANLYFSKKRGIHHKGISTFINSYYENDYNLKKQEVPQIKEIAIKWIDYILKNNSFESSTKNSFEIRKKLISETNIEGII